MVNKKKQQKRFEKIVCYLRKLKRVKYDTYYFSIPKKDVDNNGLNKKVNRAFEIKFREL